VQSLTGAVTSAEEGAMEAVPVSRASGWLVHQGVGRAAAAH